MTPNLNQRLKEIQHRVLTQQGALQSAESSLEDLSKLIKTINSEVTILTQVDLALNELSTRVMNQSTNSIDKMLTSGLRFVFDDLRLEFKTIVEKSRGKTSVRFVLMQDGQESPIMDSYGGGVIVVAGVLLRAVTIMALKARRFMFLDETLAHVSHQYVPGVSKLLNKLCTELDFDILMVTHTEAFSEYANHHFRARELKEGGTVFDKIGTSGDTDG